MSYQSSSFKKKSKIFFLRNLNQPHWTRQESMQAGALPLNFGKHIALLFKKFLLIRKFLVILLNFKTFNNSFIKAVLRKLTKIFLTNRKK